VWKGGERVKIQDEALSAAVGKRNEWRTAKKNRETALRREGKERWRGGEG
jgi:hypothetical protein